MNINKDGKVLYFSDEEIDNETNGEKKVFVTKRINGKESHVKVRESVPKASVQKETTERKNDLYSNNEIIIELNNKKENYETEIPPTRRKRKESKKKNKRELKKEVQKQNKRKNNKTEQKY